MTMRISLSRQSLLALAFLLGLGLAAPTSAFAQEDDPEEDEPEEEEEEEEEEGDFDEDESRGGIDLDQEAESARDRRRREAQAKRKKRPIREIVKGAYLKVNLGPIFWLPTISNFTSSSGTEMDISFGYDVVDTLGFTLAVEGSFFQVITNGDGVSTDIGGQIASPIQGDFRVFGGIAAVRASGNVGGKRVKRLSISGHAGGGVGYSPALVDLADPRVLSRMAYGYIMQDRPLGLVQGGLGLEYYTRLSHFSLGLDVDFNVIIGGPVIAMGLATNVFVKYTF